MTDLFGGSVNNEFLQYIDQPNIYLIAGLNLPLLIEIVTKFESADSVVELIHSVLDDSKTTIKLAKPQGVKLVIKSIADSIVALQSGVTDKYKLFIVVESIKDAQQLAEACPQIKQINLGGIKAKEGTRSLGKAVNVLPEEEERLKQLLAKNIEVEIRQVPADKKVNVKEVL
ncbi:MAG: PTS mannose/fructose/sorbose transporter subunit IIAB [Enterococcus lacertideformus]|uniref:PTS mannose/fructose/sorbose transporter subunit IIAB n=1 Tax=Enterococcus lacertideformus TaxID=2771493 RepID=A0A931AZV1_9ENTE|nr:PTS mannose/fructose/sorbose transporter subunit IIAB [Enterococcus lacertideformus]